MSEDAQVPIVEVKDLRKHYHQGAGLGHWLARGFGLSAGARLGGAGCVKALDGVSFSVRKGEAFGIIGRNGAGKSTLLQMLAGTLQPSEGSLQVRGRVTALLELGSGFNPEFSGRENIYLAGSILGISRLEMDGKLEGIEAFADIGTFIEQPVKTYSTGMLMRVAFAVAVAVQPDLLIIDEALSVGDILFQQKCNRRLRELLDGGVTLLVVTHDTAFVLNLCDRALWLDRGRCASIGTAAHVVREYMTAMSAAAGNQVAATHTEAELPHASIPDAHALDLTHATRMGDAHVVIQGAWVQDAEGRPSSTYEVGDWCRVTLLVGATREARLVSGGCELRDRHGQVVFATGLRVVRRLIERIPAGETRLISLRFKLELAPGQYTLDLGVGAGEGAENSYERIAAATVLELTLHPQQEVVHGIARLPYEVSAFVPR